MEPVKLGVVGWGGRARGLVQNILQKDGAHLFRVTAVADMWPGRLTKAREQLDLPDAAFYAHHTDMLADPDVEAVLVETGAQVMAPICCDALEAGKHVCPDVPMAFTRQQVWELVVAAEKSDAVYCMGEQVRYANFVMKWKEHIERGDIGEPLLIQGEYIHESSTQWFENKETGEAHTGSIEEANSDPDYVPTWRNALTNPITYIPHELSPLLKIISDRVTHVSCQTADTRMYGDAVGKQDLQCALMRTEKGRLMRIVNCFTSPRTGKYAHHWYHIMGTDGVLEDARPYWGPGYEFSSSADFILNREGEVIRTNYGWPREESPFGDSSQGHSGLEAFVFQEFHDVIRGKEDNEADVYTAAEAVLPGIIAAESAEAGGIQMEVPDVRPNAARAEGDYPEEP